MSATITVEDTFVITGRGIVVTGKSDGFITIGDTYTLNSSSDEAVKFKIRGIERFVNMLGQPPKEGEQIGILLGDIDRDLVPKGSVLFRVFWPRLEVVRDGKRYRLRVVDELALYRGAYPGETLYRLEEVNEE